MMTLETERLLLRPFHSDDAPVVRELLSAPEVFSTLMDIDEPLTLDAAQTMIAGWQEATHTGAAVVYAITRRSSDTLIGYIDIEMHPEHQRGEVAYWIGVPYWWQGYASEAARRVVRHGFEDLELNRIFAYCLSRNHASARVLEKAGLIYEGTFRQRAFKHNSFEDVAFYGVTREDYREHNGLFGQSN